MGIFSWIRASVKAAVISGFNDAVAELTGASGPAVPEVTEVRLLLPAPEPETGADSAPRRRGKVVS